MHLYFLHFIAGKDLDKNETSPQINGLPSKHGSIVVLSCAGFEDDEKTIHETPV